MNNDLNERMVDIIYRELNQRPTEDLVAIWTTNDREEYTDEAYEAIRRILTQRIPEGPPPQQTPEEARQAKRLNDYTNDPAQRNREGAQRRQHRLSEVRARMKIAEDIYMDGELEEALEEYDRVLEIAPRNIDALKMRGMVCEDLGLYERAIHDYLRILDLDPDNREAYKLYSEALISQAENTPEGELPDGEDEGAEQETPGPAFYLDPEANLRIRPWSKERIALLGQDDIGPQGEAKQPAQGFIGKFLSGKLITASPIYQLLLGGGAAMFLLLAALLLLAAGAGGLLPAAVLAVMGVLLGWSFFSSLARQDD